MIVEVVRRNRVQGDRKTEIAQTLQIALQFRKVAGTAVRVRGPVLNPPLLIQLVQRPGAMLVPEQGGRHPRYQVVPIDEPKLRIRAKSFYERVVPDARRTEGIKRRVAILEPRNGQGRESCSQTVPREEDVVRGSRA